MHSVFDVDAIIRSGSFKRIPESFSHGSNVHRRICFDGENNAGKTTFGAIIAPDLLTALYDDKKMSRPVLHAEEPPRLWVENFIGNDLKRITYRQIAKEHEPVPNILSLEEIKMPWIQANVFLAARRKLQEITSLNYPLPSDDYGDIGLWFNSRNDVVTVEELRKLGGMDVINIRGSASTKIFQGSDKRIGGYISELIDRCYESNFLNREDLTLIFHPRSGNNSEGSMRTDLGRKNEKDVYEGKFNESVKYWSLRGEQSFTRNLIHLENRHPDRSYIEYYIENNFEITEVAPFFMLLYLAVEQGSGDGGTTILQRNREIEVDFSLQRFFGETRIAARQKFEPLVELLEQLDNLQSGKRVDARVLRNGDVEIIHVSDDKVRFKIWE